MGRPIYWGEQEIATLKRMCAEKKTFGEIGQVLVCSADTCRKKAVELGVHTVLSHQENGRIGGLKSGRMKRGEL